MKKVTTLLLAILCSMGLASLSACAKNGGSITFTANSISSTPIKEEKSFTYKGYEFIYYNVYNDGNGNFVMADNTSYIANKDIQFGLKVKTEFVYKYVEDGDGELIYYTNLDDEGYYNYSIVDFGFVIRGVGTSYSMVYENINIGKIIHWC